MTEPVRPAEEIASELLGRLREDQPSPPRDLAELTKRRVRSSITSRDLIDLTTIVFVLHFCAPLLDLVAAVFGVVTEKGNGNGRNIDE